MCFFVLIFNNKDKIMSKIVIFAHFGLNIYHSFFIFCYFERLCLIIGKLFWLNLLRQNSKTNMTKNREKKVTCRAVAIEYFSNRVFYRKCHRLIE